MTPLDNLTLTKPSISQIQAKAVEGHYALEDITILRDAILAQLGYKLNQQDNRLILANGSDKSAHYDIYLPPPLEEQTITTLKETICLAILNTKIRKEILFPYRLKNCLHWVTGHIIIESNLQISLAFHDSANFYHKENIEEQLSNFLTNLSEIERFIFDDTRIKKIQESKHELKNFLSKKDNKIKFNSFGKSKLPQIQFSDTYCGGYTTRLICNLAANPTVYSTDKTIWCCQNQSDNKLRLEDAEIVTKYNSSKATIFGSRAEALSYTRTSTYKELSEIEQKELDKLYLEIESSLRKLGQVELNNLLAQVSKVDTSDGKKLKETILTVFGNNGEIQLENPVAYFFIKEDKPINEKSFLSKLPVFTIYKEFINIIRRLIEPNNSGMGLGNWSDPLTVGGTITSITSLTQPPHFDIGHLLAVGFRGSEYQILVLMSLLIKLYRADIIADYSATIEQIERGNLDDIGLTINKDTIEAYQIKYYDNPISVYSFFNQEDDTSDKSQKMHIGKFFDGWLNWKKENPKSLSSIVYTNTDLDEKLTKCLSGGQFAKDFISRAMRIIIDRSPSKIIGVLHKNFLTKLSTEKNKISYYASEKVWNELLTRGYVTDDQHLTEKFKNEQSQLKTRLTTLPNEVTQDQVENILKKILDTELKNRVDLYETLYQEAFKYLAFKSKDNKPISTKSDSEKDLLFKEFLQSFRFKIKQKNISELEKEIQQDLKQKLKDPPDQVFICLYYAFRDWFRQETDDQKIPKITKVIMETLIDNATTRSKDFGILQGRTQAALSHISYKTDGRTVIRSEYGILEQALSAKEEPNELTKSSSAEIPIMAVIGEKGSGKSSLIKQVLEFGHHPATYFALHAMDLVGNKPLKEDLLKTINIISEVRTIVIDSAEYLLNLPVDELKKFMKSLCGKPRKIVLTLTPDAFSQFSTLGLKIKKYEIDNLKDDQILLSFPELNSFKNFIPLIRMAKNPFYLSLIIQSIKNQKLQKKEHLNQMTEFDMIRLVHQGTNIYDSAQRKLQYQQLALKLACSPNKLSQGVPLPLTTTLKLLVNSGIIIEENKLYRFQHDLNFEFSLMEFWFQKWEIAVVEEKTDAFWQELSHFCLKYRLFPVFEKWILQYKERVSDDLLANANILSKTACYKYLVAVIISTQSKLLFNCIIPSKSLNEELHDISCYNSNTCIQLAISQNYPEGLKILLEHIEEAHHPKAGLLTIDRHNVYYQTLIQKTKVRTQKMLLDSDSDKDSKSSSDDDYYNKDNDSDLDDSVHVTSFPSEETPEESNEQRLIKYYLEDNDKYWQASFEDENNSELIEDDYLLETKLKPYEIRLMHETSYLHQAALSGRVECMSLLIEHYQKKNKKSILQLRNGAYNETVLHIAAYEDYIEMAELLLKQGALVDMDDLWEETPLHNAVYKNNIKMVELLLKFNADPNAQNKQGISPLHIAITKLELPMVKLLVQSGGDLSIIPFELNQNTDDDNLNDSLNTFLQKIEDTNYSGQSKTEEFAIDLIRFLNYGKKGTLPDPKIEAEFWDTQLEQVEDLLKFIEHRIKMTNEGLEFSETDDEDAEYNYILETGDLEKLNLIQQTILNDAEKIEETLQSKLFSKHKSQLLEKWFANATSDQRQNLIEYADNNCDDDAFEYLTNEEKTELGLSESETSQDESSSSEHSLSPDASSVLIDRLKTATADLEATQTADLTLSVQNPDPLVNQPEQSSPNKRKRSDETPDDNSKISPTKRLKK